MEEHSVTSSSERAYRHRVEAEKCTTEKGISQIDCPNHKAILDMLCKRAMYKKARRIDTDQCYERQAADGGGK